MSLNLHISHTEGLVNIQILGKHWTQRRQNREEGMNIEGFREIRLNKCSLNCGILSHLIPRYLGDIKSE